MVREEGTNSSEKRLWCSQGDWQANTGVIPSLRVKGDALNPGRSPHLRKLVVRPLYLQKTYTSPCFHGPKQIPRFLLFWGKKKKAKSENS